MKKLVTFLVVCAIAVGFVLYFLSSLESSDTIEDFKPNKYMAQLLRKTPLEKKVIKLPPRQSYVDPSNSIPHWEEPTFNTLKFTTVAMVTKLSSTQKRTLFPKKEGKSLMVTKLSLTEKRTVFPKREENSSSEKKSEDELKSTKGLVFQEAEAAKSEVHDGKEQTSSSLNTYAKGSDRAEENKETIKRTQYGTFPSKDTKIVNVSDVAKQQDKVEGKSTTTTMETENISKLKNYKTVFRQPYKHNRGTGNLRYIYKSPITRQGTSSQLATTTSSIVKTEIKVKEMKNSSDILEKVNEKVENGKYTKQQKTFLSGPDNKNNNENIGRNSLNLVKTDDEEKDTGLKDGVMNYKSGVIFKGGESNGTGIKWNASVLKSKVESKNENIKEIRNKFFGESEKGNNSKVLSEHKNIKENGNKFGKSENNNKRYVNMKKDQFTSENEEKGSFLQNGLNTSRNSSKGFKEKLVPKTHLTAILDAMKDGDLEESQENGKRVDLFNVTIKERNGFSLSDETIEKKSKVGDTIKSVNNNILQSDAIFDDELKNDKRKNFIQDKTSSDVSVRNSRKTKLKKILLWTPFFNKEKWWFEKMGQYQFIRDNCEVNTCEVTLNRDDVYDVDALLFNLRNLGGFPSKHPPHQPWVLVNLESPINSLSGNSLTPYDRVFNWTSFYDQASTVRLTYGLTYVKKVPKVEEIDFVRGRKNRAIAFISNCGPSNRLRFLANLQHYYPVDLYGRCGKRDPCSYSEPCLRKLVRGYKYYLSLENSFCREYITEKFWLALRRGTVPIILGARKDDYAAVAPPNSFIHVDSHHNLVTLVRYLQHLDRNDDEYVQFYEWRINYGVSADLSNLRDYNCRLCAALHNTSIPRQSQMLSNWWDPHKQCIQLERT